jgi:hypothetical protein
MASSGGNPLLHPIRYWRHWVICFGGSAAAIYGSQPVAEAMGDLAFAYVYIAVVSALMLVGVLWANRRDDEHHSRD